MNATERISENPYAAPHTLWEQAKQTRSHHVRLPAAVRRFARLWGLAALGMMVPMIVQFVAMGDLFLVITGVLAVGILLGIYSRGLGVERKLKEDWDDYSRATADHE